MLWAAFAPLAAGDDSVADALHARMEELQFSGNLTIGGAPVAARRILPALYAGRDFRLLWNDEARIEELLALLESAPEHGLEVADYHLGALRARIAAARLSGWALDKADRDILLSEALIRFVYHQQFGKVNPVALDADINFTRAFPDGRRPIDAIPGMIASPETLRVQLEKAIHRGPIYRAFQRHLAEHRRIVAAGGWPTVAPAGTLRRGADGPRVAALRARLAVSDDLPPADDTGSRVFDDRLEAAVMRFQARHGLGVDGIVGARTLAALNVPAETRVDQLRLSLERLRWVRGERAERFVAVNIAGFRVLFVVDDDIVWTARAMVGTPFRRTPIFRGNLHYLEINPSWTLPPIVIKEDVLPAIKRDAGYLRARNMTLIDQDGRAVDPERVDWSAYSEGIPYTIRQEPGPHNALGRIKFVFPNEHFVFMHDTPSQGLFDRPQRAFSSGCIRVENPFDLAELVLNDPLRWNRQTLAAIRDQGHTRRIATPERIPVLILYLTASIEPDGRPRFLEDVYERDARLLEALNGPVRIDLPAW